MGDVGGEEGEGEGGDGEGGDGEGGDGEQASSPRFFWGERDGLEFADSLDIAYREAVHWKPNLF